MACGRPEGRRTPEIRPCRHKGLTVLDSLATVALMDLAKTLTAACMEANMNTKDGIAVVVFFLERVFLCRATSSRRGVCRSNKKSILEACRVLAVADTPLM